MASPKVKVTKRTRRQRPVPEVPVESEAGQSTVEMTDKEKRRMNAQLGWDRLGRDADLLPDLPCPASLGDRLSFTVKDPYGQGSSVGVILNTESFYISKAVKPASWPTTCKHLKVGSSMGVSAGVFSPNSHICFFFFFGLSLVTLPPTLNQATVFIHSLANIC